MKMSCYGIDVCAKTLEICCLRGLDLPTKPARPRRLQNTPSDHQTLIEEIRKQDGAVRVVCEATGVYHLDLAMALAEAKIPLMVCNPRQVKDFIRARQRFTQTDPIDAYELAQFGLRMDFVPWRAPGSAAFALHRIARALHTYVEQATALKNRLHAAESLRHTPKIILQTLRDELAFNEKLQQRLTAKALSLIAQDQQLRACMTLLLSVPGIAQTSAVQILGELCVLPPELSAKAWVKLAGLDPVNKRSGSSVHTKPCISKRGNAKLRGSLFLPALCARRFDPGLRTFADRLVHAGKTKLQAVVAVQRKLLHGIHAMFATGLSWDSSKLVKTA